jgi:hypothetical protein
MWRIWWAPNKASKWQMGFNLAFKGLTSNLRPLLFWLSTTNLPRITSQKSDGGGSPIIWNWPYKYWTCASNLRFVKQFIELRLTSWLHILLEWGKVWFQLWEVKRTPCIVSLHPLHSSSLAIITALDVVTVWRFWRQFRWDSYVTVFCSRHRCPVSKCIISSGCVVLWPTAPPTNPWPSGVRACFLLFRLLFRRHCCLSPGNQPSITKVFERERFLDSRCRYKCYASRGPRHVVTATRNTLTFTGRKLHLL